MSRKTRRVLTRKPGEVVRIGSGITVGVTRITAGRVHLCVEAPAGAGIFQHEAYVATIEENRRAVLPGPIYLHAAAALLPTRHCTAIRNGGKTLH